MHSRKFSLLCACLLSPFVAGATDYSEAIRQLEPVVRAEMAAKGITGISIALVDDRQIVHLAGYGDAKPDSIFRCGSISKVVNAVAVMQLVEQGKLDLDAPIERYGREFKLHTPFEDAGPVTLRQLLCHRSGIVRESPVGGYLDPSEPGIEKTIASMDRCVLVNPPNNKTRYSNIGPTIAGQIAAKVAGLPYERYQQQHVLGPVGMASSSYLLKGVPRDRVMTAHMRVADGRGGYTHEKAPLFDLGTLPAGNLFTTAGDLGRFIAMLAADGRAGGQRILSSATLEQMFTPQLTTNEAGFGLGFNVGKFRGHKTVNHGGAVYGYSSTLVFLPAEKIGVVVLSNEDIVNAPVNKLTYLAVSLMLHAKIGKELPPQPQPIALPPAELMKFIGEYESPSYWAHLEIKDGRLVGNASGQPLKFTPVEPLTFIVDSRMTDDTPIEFTRADDGRITGFTLMGQKFARVPDGKREIPAHWKRYFGSYGPSFIPLLVHARNGHLYATTENMVDYRLTPVNEHVFAFPPGMYVDEHAVFLTNTKGKVYGVNMANMVLRRL